MVTPFLIKMAFNPEFQSYYFELFTFPLFLPHMPEYQVNKLVCLSLVVCLSLQESQPRTQKYKGKTIFPPLPW